ncbi:MAG: hypothetical protein JRH20_27540 [Deltaproteobacteria bacterium]|nr:hypothetical protein [Deltaproteobacteria bacterium]
MLCLFRSYGPSFLPLTLSVLIACSAGCAGNAAPSDDGGIDCEKSESTGLYLLGFGPVVQDLLVGGSAQVSVIVTRAAAGGQDGHPEADYSVSFRIVNPVDGVTLERSEGVTDLDGIATVGFTSSKDISSAIYMVEASSPDTCSVNFTMDVRRPLRQLRALTRDPFDTFTRTRVPITVEATTDGNVKIPNQPVVFTLGRGKTAQHIFSTVDAQASGETITINTDGTGRAIAMLTTGERAISQLEVHAEMSGTAPAMVVVRIFEGGAKACQDATQCPLGYNCNVSLGVCEPPPPGPTPSGCSTNAQCQPPTICDAQTGRCLEPTGGQCDPIEGTGCTKDEVCIGGLCAHLPAGCVNNAECPATWVCAGGSCAPAGAPTGGGCLRPEDCPDNETCINGDCRPKSVCNILHDPDRLKGTWQFDSRLNLSDALGGFVGSIMGASEALRDLVDGDFGIDGIPSFLQKTVGKYVSKVMHKYVPPWTQSMIVTLGNLNDVIDDMRVVSTVQVNPVGPDRYVCSERWELLEFEYRGTKISSPPSAIPEIGDIKIENYTSAEVCGEWFLGRHAVKNKVGGLIKWALEAALNIGSCVSSDVPCFSSIEHALMVGVECGMIGMQIDQLIMSMFPSAPSIANFVSAGCEAAKVLAASQLSEGLEGLKTKLTFLELSGTVKLPTPGQDTKLENGVWNGTLGYPLLKGDFDGSFTAYR